MVESHQSFFFGPYVFIPDEIGKRTFFKRGSQTAKGRRDVVQFEKRLGEQPDQAGTPAKLARFPVFFQHQIFFSLQPLVQVKGAVGGTKAVIGDDKDGVIFMQQRKETAHFGVGGLVDTQQGILKVDGRIGIVSRMLRVYMAPELVAGPVHRTENDDPDLPRLSGENVVGNVAVHFEQANTLLQHFGIIVQAHGLFAEEFKGLSQPPVDFPAESRWISVREVSLIAWRWPTGNERAVDRMGREGAGDVENGRPHPPLIQPLPEGRRMAKSKVGKGVIVGTG